MKLLCNFLHSPVTSSLFGPNILLSNLFSNTLSLYSSLNVKDQVSPPYRTTGKIILLYNLNYENTVNYKSFCDYFKPSNSSCYTSTTCSNTRALYVECIFVFRTVLTINSNFFPPNSINRLIFVVET
jgi:hypothetical protein